MAAFDPTDAYIGPSLRLKKLTPREVTYLVQMAQLVSG